MGDAAHLGLEHVTQGKQRARHLLLREPVQEIALVLGRIGRFQHSCQLAALVEPRVVPGGDVFGARAMCKVEKGLELDFSVAQHIGVGRASGLQFGKEIGEDAVAVFRAEVHRIDFQPDDVGHRQHVKKILPRRAMPVVVLFPVPHEHAKQVVSLLFQQIRGDRGIDAAGHADDDAPSHGRAQST